MKNGEYKHTLAKGAEAFKSVIEVLKNMKPLKGFEPSDDIKVICPDKIDEQPKFEEHLEQLRIRHPEKKIEFNYDLVLAKPEIITVLQLVDDEVNNVHSRRSNLLSEEFEFLGLSIKKSKGKKFSVYLTFSG